MIHQVRANPGDVKKLAQVVELQLLVLEVVAAHAGEVNTVAISDHLKKSYRNDPDRVDSYDECRTAKWIIKKKKELLDKLNIFAAHSDTNEKRQFVAQLRADVALLYSPRPEKFQVVFDRKTDEQWKTAASDFLVHFYELWRADTKEPGFPSHIFPYWSGPEQSYNRWGFLDSFQRVNPHLTMCVMCDATAFRTQVDSRAFVSIEHFFPKAVYPQFAIHPYNLVPICSYCNSVKRDFDLLATCNNNKGITELLLPYQQHEHGLETMAYIEVAERTGQGQDTPKHPLEIKLKPARAHPLTGTLIDHFEQAYDVQKRWNNELDQVIEQAFRRTQQFLTGDVLMGNDLSDIEFLTGRLQLLMAITSSENLGRDPHAMTTVWLLKYWIDEIKTSCEASLIYRNLCDWAAEHKEEWEELRREVAVLSSRVPVIETD